MQPILRTIRWPNGANYLAYPEDEGWFGIDHIDLTGVKSLNILINNLVASKNDFPFEKKLDYRKRFGEKSSETIFNRNVAYCY